jgi:hypothetical protein
MANKKKIIKLAQELRNEISEITYEDVDECSSMAYGHALDLADLMINYLKQFLREK